MRQPGDIGAHGRCLTPPRRGGGAVVRKTPQWRFSLHRYTSVRALLLASSLVLATVAAPAFAQPSAPAATPQAQSGSTASSPAASAAETTVNTFMTDLANGQLDAARELMTPDAVVMANGVVLGDRDAYFNGAAKGDVAALRNTQRELLHRAIQAGNEMAWVVSEKRVRHAGTDQGPREIVVTETMALAKTASGWKIAHIHWSTRAVG